MEADLGMRRRISLDTEDNKLDVFDNDFAIVGISLAGDDRTGYYIPVGHRLPPGSEAEEPAQLSQGWVLSRLNRFLAGRRMIGAHHKFDGHVLEQYGVGMGPTVFDVLLAAPVHDSRNAQRSLDVLVFEKLGYKPMKIEDLVADVKPPILKSERRPGKHMPKKKQRLGFEFLTPEKALSYAAADAVDVVRLRDWYVSRITDPGDSTVLSLEMEVMPVIKRMESVGVLLDEQKVQRLYDVSFEMEEERRDQLRELSGDADLNPGSGQQMGDIIYHQMGVSHPKGKKVFKRGATPPKGWLDKTMRDKLAVHIRSEPKDNYGGWPKDQVLEFLDLYTQYKAIGKFRTTYTLSMLDLLSSDGRLHTGIHQIVETGRSACVSENTILDTDKGRFRIVDVPLGGKENPRITTHRGRMRRILRRYYKGRCQMFRVTISNGNWIDCTPLHRLLTMNCWKHLYELNEGDRVRTNIDQDYESTIVAIEPIGIQDVWDIEVEEDHSYVAQGLIHKNSAGPNLQNLPRADNPIVKQLDLRAAMVADPGWKFVKADYAAQEMRLIAALSQDPTMMAIFTGKMLDDRGDPIDIHAYVGSLAFREPYMEIVDAVRKKNDGGDLTDRDIALVKVRQDSKPVNFGIAYGAGPMTIATQIKGTEQLAEHLLLTWKTEAFPHAARWFESQVAYLRQHLYTQTVLGRKRRISPRALKLSRGKFSGLARQGQNHPLQGGAADMTKQAMVRVDAELQRQLGDENARLTLVIHDELIVLVKDHAIDTAKHIIETQMATDLMGVHFPADAEVSDNLSKKG